MNYICFLCNKKLKTIHQLIYHLKIIHNLDKNSYYCCKQTFCHRNFRGLHKFRQHLNRNHVYNQENDRNDIISSLAPFEDTIINESININPLKFDPLVNYNDNTDYELSEQTILLNELVSSDVSHDTENINLPPFKKKVEKVILSFIANLMTKSNVSGSLLQEIIEGIINIFSSELIVDIKSKVLSVLRKLNSSEYSTIENMFETVENSFSSVKTEYFRTKTLLKHNVFFKPETIVVGYTKEKRNVDGNDKIVMVPVQGHLLSMKKNLKYFFELPDVFKIVNNFINDSLNNKEILTSFLDGSTWKNMRSKFKNQFVFPIFLYYDDVELGNPLGSHSGIHKMGCVYYTVPGLPPEYLSSLNNIFPAFLFHAQDRGYQSISNEQMFSALVKELVSLQEEGIMICINGEEIKIYFTLGLVLGDNLGLNSILGFVESFTANFYCRICRSPKQELQQMCHQSNIFLRNVINYESDIKHNNVSETGVREQCIFHKIQHFHVTENLVCDFMHDIPEGVARYDMALIISGLIDQGCFTLNELNNRLRYFNYGTTERKNVPPLIRETNIKKGILIMSASEMLCLIRFFSLMVGELVPTSSNFWKLYLLLYQITDLCCARKIQRDSSFLLDSLVYEHNKLYLLLSKSTLKPKFHMLTHYGHILRKNGPIILTSSIRFEAKHKILKSLANVIPCRINLGYTIANKLQLQMVNRLLLNTAFKDQNLKLGIGKCINSSSEFSQKIFTQLPKELKINCFLASWLEFKGIYYKKKVLVVMETNLDGSIFGEIVFILVGESKVPFFLLKPLNTIGYDFHYHAYEIGGDNLNDNNNLVGYYVHDLCDPTPTVLRIIGNNKRYATLRYAL